MPGDGHCCLHSFLFGLENLCSREVSLNKNHLCEKILEEVHKNWVFYKQFALQGQDILSDINQYVWYRRYNNNTNDLVLNILSNAFGVEVPIYCTHQGQVTCTIQTPKDSNVKGIVKLFLTSGTSSHYDAIGPIKHNTSTKDFISPCTPVVINDDQDLTTDLPAITSSSPMILVQNTTDKSLISVQSSLIPPVVLSPESILPFPKAGKLVNARRRNRRKSAILTDTPVKKC